LNPVGVAKVRMTEKVILIFLSRCAILFQAAAALQ